MTIKNDILVFLLTNPHIQKLEYRLRWYTIAPKEYRYGLYGAIQKDDIIIRTKGASGPKAGASYDYSYDSFELTPNFNITNWSDQAFFIHECTHAVIDMKNIGKHSAHEDEAMAYMAEALFLEAAKKPPLGKQSIRKLAHQIAKQMLKAHKKKVPNADAGKLVKEIAKHPMYKTTALYNSNRFNRGFIHWLLR